MRAPARRPNIKARIQRLALLGMVLILGQLAGLRPALAWWNGDWSYRVKVNADTTAKGADVAGPIGHMQVLVRLYSGNFNFSTVKEDGSDLRVVAADDRTPLKFQFEKFDGLVDQVALIWVDVPDVAANGTTSFYLYWGNKNAVSGSDGKDAFAGNDALVYHFDEENGVPRDTTAYANNAQTGGKSTDGGMVGTGVHLDGTKLIAIPASASLALAAGQATTYSLWVHPDGSAASGVLYDARSGANELLIGIDNHVLYVQVTTATGTTRSTPGAAIPATGWHLITVESADHTAILVDGHADGQLAGPLPALAGSATLGGAPAPVAAPAPAAPPPAPAPATAPVAGAPAPEAASPAAPAVAPPANFVGTIDEFRIVKDLEPAGVTAARVAAEGPTPKLIALDKPEQASLFGTGTLGIILRSVDPIAWGVISILAVMALISWVVMIGKAIYVSGVNGANTRFRRAYRDQVRATNGDVLGTVRGMHRDQAPKFKGSSLYRLNEVAAFEIDERLHGGVMDAQGSMPARSIAAIRSAMEGRLEIEKQHLNRMMVLLTIAIAGGPFIGLLGTVIGVMVTFAAIAAAGDVNINAIAPGISAALLATVAGLFVAIPALFGYNYLNTRISDAITDMHVHIDNLVTRMGEGLFAQPTSLAAE